MSEEIARKNALRIAEALAYLERSQKALNEIDLRSVRGLSREQLKELRDNIKAVKASLAENRGILRTVDAARATYFHAPEAPAVSGKRQA